MNPRRSIEIIGGGLAGLSLGLALRRAGVAVRVIEAGAYPRHRVCGEFIAGLSDRTIADLGLREILRPALLHREVAWHMRDGLMRIQRLPAPALGISRLALDAALADAFVAAGGDLQANRRATDFDAVPGRIYATGRRRGSSPWIGLKVHARRLELTRDLEVHLGDEAYVGLSLVEGGVVNVCGLFRRRAIGRRTRGPDVLIEYLAAAGMPGLADRLRLAVCDPESFSAVAALSFGLPARPQDRIWLGDAWAMIPPFTGNGMAMAFQSAALALDPILHYARGACTWPTTCRDVNARLRSHFRIRLASARVLHPFLLRPGRQHWLRLLNRGQLLPFDSLYAALH